MGNKWFASTQNLKVHTLVRNNLVIFSIDYLESWYTRLRYGFQTMLLNYDSTALVDDFSSRCVCQEGMEYEDTSCQGLYTAILFRAGQGSGACNGKLEHEQRPGPETA